MRILVCVKQVLDPEASPAALHIDSDGVSVCATGTPPVINPYDANALKAAFDLRGEDQAEIIVLSVGHNPSAALLAKTLAAGADRVIVLRTQQAGGRLGDGMWSAHHLAALVRRVGAFDLILTGRQAADTNAGTTGPALAALLGVPLVTIATELRRGAEGEVVVDRLAGEHIETVACPLPVLITVSSEIGDLLPVSVRDLVAAKKKPVEFIDIAALPEAAPCPEGIELMSLEKPSRERACRMLATADARSSGALLVKTLMADGVLDHR